MNNFQKNLLVTAVFFISGIFCSDDSTVIKNVLKPLEKLLGVDPDTGLNLVSCQDLHFQ